MENPEQKLVVEAINRWKSAARAALFDINEWRENPQNYGLSSIRRCPTFFADTVSVLMWIVQAHPSLDLTPVQRFYDIASTWYSSHQSSSLPSREVLTTLADNAAIPLIVAEEAIYKQDRKRCDDASQPKRRSTPLCDRPIPPHFNPTTEISQKKLGGEEAEYHSTVMRAFQFIKNNTHGHEGPKGTVVAKVIAVTPDHFRRRLVPQLKPLGVRNDGRGDGYYFKG